ncbi:MAG: 2-phosphosulfolactate phosphatase [Planctomycetota bacterium]
MTAAINLTRLRGVEAAASARGAVVVIDVLRAFTTAAYALASGAREIVLVGTVEQAFALRRQWPNSVLVGESGGRPIAGFDHGNSPAAMRSLDLRNKTVVLRSSSGTQGVVRAVYADEILLGSLVVASATAAWLRARAAHVTLLAMGSAAGPDGPEDDACADHIAALLQGEPADPAQVAAAVRASPAGRQALDPTIDWIVADDLDCAVALDCFRFAMPVHRDRSHLIATRAAPPPVT